MAASPPAPPRLLLLTYTYVSDIMEKRTPHRPGHLAAAQREVDAGRLLMAGAFADEPFGGAFVWTPRATREDVEKFVATDPYVLAGLVTAHRVADWMLPVLSPAAADALSK